MTAPTLQPRARLGAVAPESLQFVIAQGDSGIDLTTVTAASMCVRKPNGVVTTWPAIVGAATATKLLVQHAFEPGDLDQLNSYAIYISLTVPSGTVRTPPRTLVVLGPFAT